MFDRIHDGRIKAVWIMATNPVVSLPDADKVKAALRKLRVRGGVGRHGQHRHRGARARAAAGARLGREGRHGHQLRSHHLAAARSSCRRPARRARTGASSATWRAPWASPASISFRRTRSSASMRGSRRMHNDGRRALESRRLGRHHRQPNTRTGSPRPGPWRSRANRRAARCSPTESSCTPTASARFLALTPRAARTRAHAGISAGAQHRPRARSLAHHDAHRQVRAPVGAHRRALRRDQHRRRAALRGARRRAGHAAIELGLDGGARAHRRRRASGHGVRAYPLEPRVRLRCARGRASTNPVVDPISGEPELKHTPVCHRTLRGRLVWRDAHARAAAAAARRAGGRGCSGEQFVRYELAGSESRGLVARGAPLAGRAGRRRRTDVDWIEYRDPARRVYRAAWFVDDRLAGLHLRRPPRRRCPSAPGWRECSPLPKLDAARARQPARRAARSKAPTRARWCVRASAWAAIPSPPARASWGRGHARRGNRQAPQVRHELRLLRRRRSRPSFGRTRPPGEGKSGHS